MRFTITARKPVVGFFSVLFTITITTIVLATCVDGKAVRSGTLI
jgi:hypothetical protein